MAVRAGGGASRGEAVTPCPGQVVSSEWHHPGHTGRSRAGSFGGSELPPQHLKEARCRGLPIAPRAFSGVPVTVTPAHGPGCFPPFPWETRPSTFGCSAAPLPVRRTCPGPRHRAYPALFIYLFIKKNPKQNPPLFWRVLRPPVSSAKHHLGVTADIPAISGAAAHRSGSRNPRGIYLFIGVPPRRGVPALPPRLPPVSNPEARPPFPSAHTACFPGIILDGIGKKAA